MTLEQMLAIGERRFEQAGLFFGHGMDNAADEALMLALHALGLDYDCDAGILQQQLDASQMAAIDALFTRRIAERRPAAYITGRTWFAGLPFHVDERVLIPRSPIAELIVSGFSPWVEPGNVHRILDLCTGSGCIAVACAHYLPDVMVDASDISADALQVAHVNVEMHDLRKRVTLIESDLFDAIDGPPYDIIVSNPPYVSTSEVASLPEEYRYEPILGLASGGDGLDAVRTILREAARHLTDDGILVCEVGHSRDAVIEAWPDVPFLWLEFEFGGEGVFLLTREQLPVT